MKNVWNTDELSNLWSLSFEEMERLKTKLSRSHLGFSIQLKYYENTGLFPQQCADISESPLHYLCSQLECKSQELDDYNWKGRSGRRHRLEILSFLKIKTAKENDKGLFSKWLITEIYPTDPEGNHVYDHAYEWFLANKLECPASKELSRLINSAEKNTKKIYFN